MEVLLYSYDFFVNIWNSLPNDVVDMASVQYYYPHMPIGMLGIYRLLYFIVCRSVRRILVTDISGVG